MEKYGDAISQVVDVLKIVLSTLVISGINIAISGHILGYVFNLDESGDNYFNLPLRPVLKLRIIGNRVFAGFAAFTISLLIVGFFMPSTAQLIFIERLQATESVWLANQSLAAGISVIGCLVLGAFRMIYMMIKARKAIQPYEMSTPSLQERANNLINKS